MGRFLGASPTATGERRRYEMLSEHDDTAQQASPATQAERVQTASPSSATSRSALMRSDSELEAEAEAEAEEAQQPTLQRQHQEASDEAAGQEVAAPETMEEKKDKEDPEEEQQASNNEDAAAEDPQEDPDAIHVRILDLNGKFFNIACHLDWTVAQMKQKVLESTEVAVTSQRLIYRGRVLEDDATLDSYKVEDGITIHLFVRAAPTPDPEILNAELNANGSTVGGRDDGITVVNINSDIVSSAVFPSDSARRVDPLMLDSPLGNCARRVKLWSSFLLIIYTMKVMGQFALLANDQQQRAAQQEQEAAGAGAGASETEQPMERYDDYPQYYTPDPLIGGIELMVHCFGVYVGCVGFKAAHDTDIRPIRFFFRGVVWLALLTVAEQIYTTVQISETDFPTERVQYPYGGQGPTKDDIVSANIFQTIMLLIMWLIAIRHSYLHVREVSIYNQSFAAAAMNAAPPVHLPEVV